MPDDHDDLVRALEAAGCTIQGRKVVCAFHGDRNASGSIHQAEDGRWRYRCFACGVRGDAADIQALTTGRPLAEVLREQRGQETQPMRQSAPPRDPQRFPTLDALIEVFGSKVEEVYRYAHPVTREVELAVIRLAGKSFPQASPAPGGGWWMRRPPGILPIYNRARVLEAELVAIVEGEKDVHALHEVGVVATTSPMGADDARVHLEDDGKPGLADWSPLAGKQVVLWGDDDEPGRRHLERVARILGRLTPRPTLRRIDRSTLDGAKDAAELIENQAGVEQVKAAVQRVIDGARAHHASAPLAKRLEAMIAGKIIAIPWPWSALGHMTQALLPGTVTLLVGKPGATKSFLLIQALLWWQSEGHRIAFCALEDQADTWLQRALALASGQASITDPSWIRSHPLEVREIMTKYRARMDELAQVITIPPDGFTMPKLAAWIDQQAQAGARIIVADPLTGALPEVEPWVAAQQFMGAIKRSAESSGASIVLTSHGKQGDNRGKVPDVESLAGGAAFSRFAHTILWLDRFTDPEPVSVIDGDGREVTANANRHLRILKARNGKSQGRTIAMHFSMETLRTAELGVIVRRTKGTTQPAPPPSRAHHFHEPRDSEDHFKETEA